MKKINFTIYGNQENRYGNPIPYLRTTQGSQWTPKAVRYQSWKGHVVATYLDTMQAITMPARADFGDVHDLIQRKPIAKSTKKIRMDLMITFIDKTHADCDNIYKGIADALFMNDKYVCGGSDYQYGSEGKVEVTIEWE